MKRSSWFFLLFWIVFIVGAIAVFNHIKYLPNGSVCRIEYEVRQIQKTPVDQSLESFLDENSTVIGSGVIITNGADVHELDSTMKFHVSKVGHEFCYLTFDNEVKELLSNDAKIQTTNVIKLAEYVKRGDPRFTDNSLNRLNKLGKQQAYILQDGEDTMYIYVVRLTKRGVN